MLSVSTIFKFYADDSLKLKLKEWMMLAITNRYTDDYTNKIEIANLVVFCEKLQKVIEALYLLSVAYTEDIHEEVLNLNNSCVFLTEEEQNNPYIVLKAFKNQFPLIHVQSEMWDIFHAIVRYKEHKEIKRHTLVDTFKDLFCIAQAAFIQQEDENLLTILKKLRTEQKNQVAKNNF